ncbi:MAG TPA: zinc-binding dehydrogenase, partial [Burkholderiales bacterium]|nr:zinc-binding dehydrogenase [Burkholderiales bacterium]
MKAVVLKQHGAIDSLEYVTDFPDPRAADGHVVIRVGATSFNYHDIFTVRGMPGIKVPMPMIIGLDIAGEILEVGAGVAGWKAGDRVLVNPLNKQKGLMGEMMHGGLAEKCLVAADQLIRMPDGVSYEQAAALPVAYGTAHRMIITHDTVRKGEKVLVLGASGGVGTGCVLLAKMLGAEVIACASSADKIQRLKDLGADHVINYREQRFETITRKLTNKKGVDVVFEHVGGEGFNGSLLVLKRGGRLVTCGSTAGPSITF